ncbi:MAG TPA: hypothetical protein VHZ52_04700 [Acidobacteriaceae bacterium]|jgi:hypothetical protein|nr:hypothetical protein [Acidobacteriaceae bacterium]
MSITKLQAAHDKVVADGIGVYLPVMKFLLASIKEHIAEDAATSAATKTTTATPHPLTT